MSVDVRNFRVSAYATSPSFHGWNGALEAQYFAGLAADARVVGIEHPFFDDGGNQYPVGWLVDNLPAHWSISVTVMPGLMRNARTQPHFGLASAHEPSRSAALAMVERLRIQIDALHTRLGRSVVQDLHLHSSPANTVEDVRGNVAAFDRSLQECLALGWEGIRVLIEHCDAPVAGHAPDKGFLTLEEEVELAAKHEIGLMLNWARSAIETRSTEGPLDHLGAVERAGLLHSFCFSGCASKSNPDYGIWRDTHMPAAPIVPSPWLRADSLLGAREIADTLLQLRAAARPITLGVKILDPAPDLDVVRKVRLNLDTIAAIAAVAEERLSPNCSEVTAIRSPNSRSHINSPITAGIATQQPEPFIATINRRAEALYSSGRSVLKLSGGDPQHTPDALRGILTELAIAPDAIRMLNYSPVVGFEDLRRRLVSFVTRRYSRELTPDMLMVTSGGCSGLFLSLKTMVGAGDIVLIPDPCWEYLPRMVEQCGAIPERLPMQLSANSTERTRDFVSLAENRLAQGCVRALVVNSPLNPVGDVLSAEQLQRLALACQAHGAWLLSDEVTIDFQYGGRTTDLSVLDHFDNVVSVQSFSKNFGLTGFRFGYVIAPAAFLTQAAKTQLYTMMYPCSLVQEVVHRFLGLGEAETDSFLLRIKTTFEQHATEFVGLLTNIDGVEVQKPDGGLFLFPRVVGSTSRDWVDALDTHGVAISPGAAFGTNCDDHIRLFIGVDTIHKQRCADFLRNMSARLR
jgi:aspartate/methionine/tyrosine aminotransferase